MGGEPSCGETITKDNVPCHGEEERRADLSISISGGSGDGEKVGGLTIMLVRDSLSSRLGEMSRVERGDLCLGSVRPVEPNNASFSGLGVDRLEVVDMVDLFLAICVFSSRWSGILSELRCLEDKHCETEESPLSCRSVSN